MLVACRLGHCVSVADQRSVVDRLPQQGEFSTESCVGRLPIRATRSYMSRLRCHLDETIDGDYFARPNKECYAAGEVQSGCNSLEKDAPNGTFAVVLD